MYDRLLKKQRDYFFQGETRDMAFRIKQLKKLKKAVEVRETELMDALRMDLNKSKEEAFLTELGPLYQEIGHIIKHLPKWAKEKKVETPVSQMGSESYIYHEPHGVALVIAPWNYPLQLALAPVVGSIAGGNCTVIKPSELTPHTSKMIAALVSETFPKEYIAVVEGAVETSQALLAERFDYIFFTGSVVIGKVVMEAASKHLTPVTLELGGKSPAIVDKKAKVDLAARRIAWGKFLNAGQTCVAPDYVYVHEDVKDQFIKRLDYHIQDLFRSKLEKGEYPRIVSERHFDRLLSFLQDGDVVIGGQHERDTLVISPSVMTNVEWDQPIMQEEIFGPILPVFSYSKLDEVMTVVRERPSPLALYVFTADKKVEEKLIHGLPFGGGCLNDTVMHLATPHLPFGGKGESGMGAYHGYESFAAFTHRKSILKQSTSFDLPLRYKQGRLTMKLLRKLFQ